MAELLADLPDPDDARFRFSFGAAECSAAQPPATLRAKSDGPDVVIDLDLRRLRGFCRRCRRKGGDAAPGWRVVADRCGVWRDEYVLMPLCSENASKRRRK